MKDIYTLADLRVFARAALDVNESYAPGAVTLDRFVRELRALLECSGEQLRAKSGPTMADHGYWSVDLTLAIDDHDHEPLTLELDEAGERVDLAETNTDKTKRASYSDAESLARGVTEHLKARLVARRK
jgi:hypothetical protein